MTVVDVWLQHPTQRFLTDPMFATLLRWTGQEAADIPLAATLQALAQAEVAAGLLTAWWGPRGALIDNDEVAACIRQAPERLVGIASVDLAQPMAGVRELRRAVGELGFKGLRVLPWLWGLPPDDRRYYPLYAECIELDIPFCLQVGHTGPLRSSEPGRPIPYLEHVALEFPELRIVAGHIGYPWTQEMISLARRFTNVYIDTSAYKATRYPAELVAYLKADGRHKVMFGSNYPMITPADCLAGLAGLALEREVMESFLSGNARRVFHL